jgi:amidase
MFLKRFSKLPGLAGLLGLVFTIVACSNRKEEPNNPVPVAIWEAFSDSADLAANANHPIARMRFKRIQSAILDKSEVFKSLYSEAFALDSATYIRLLPLILEQPIPVIQENIRLGKFNYETLTRFYLYRIFKFELNRETTLHTIVALNNLAIAQARNCDAVVEALPNEKRHPIFGMPILLKDNIGVAGMPTTAGAAALKNNITDDAFITRQLKQNGAIILGKVNLSEWAYYFCEGCPVGYSAIGGQTLNPYGRGQFETGGSSSGSGTASAAGYAVATVGTETSGSILSPSGQNGIVGLKPTIGLLSRSGIIPISGTLDTPGPMATNVTNAAILLDAMKGYDMEDFKAGQYYLEGTGFTPRPYSFSKKRFGVFPELLSRDSLYSIAIMALRDAGAEIFEIQTETPDLVGFSTLLNADMKKDLAVYLSRYVQDTASVWIRSAADVLKFNTTDTLLYAPYGQARMEGVVQETSSTSELEVIKSKLKSIGRNFLLESWQKYNLNGILSVNNRHAGLAAVAEYPALVVPMGFRNTGEPAGITFIGKPFQEELLLDMGQAFELLIPARKMPDKYVQ